MVVGCLVAALSITAVLATDGGRIRVECEDPELLLEILRNDQISHTCPANELAEFTWFRSGNYEVRLPEDSQDEFTVVNGAFSLKRSDRLQIVIERVSTRSYEDYLSVSPNIWNSAPLSQFTSSHRSVDILTSDDWEWTPPQAFLPGINDGITGVHYPTLTPDGLTMMFGRLMEHVENEPTRILVAVRPSLASPFQVRYEIPTPYGWDYGMHLAKFDRCMFYFTTEDSEVAFRNTDLKCLRYGDDGSWDPLEIFQNVNTRWHERDPTVSADGLKLIFSSRRLGGQGDYDLWVATRSSVNEAFDPPVNMGESIYTPGQEGFAELSADSLVLIYNSYKDQHQTQSFRIATRQSTDEEFSNPRPLELPCEPDMTQRDAALALNGRLLVFRQRPVTDPLKLTLHYCQRVPKCR